MRNLQDDNLKPLACSVLFDAYLFSCRQQCLSSAKVDEDLPELHTLHHSSDNFPFLISVFLKYSAVLGFMKALQNNLFCGLSSNTPGIIRGILYHHGIIHLRLGIKFLCLLQ